MISIASSVDLAIAQDRSQPPATRAAAWERYEIDAWTTACTKRGLLIRSLDTSRTGLDGDSIQQMVTRKLVLSDTARG